MLYRKEAGSGSFSCPNYLGEILEWLGWAVATWSSCGLAFMLFTRRQSRSESAKQPSVVSGQVQRLSGTPPSPDTRHLLTLARSCIRTGRSRYTGFFNGVRISALVKPGSWHRSDGPGQAEVPAGHTDVRFRAGNGWSSRRAWVLMPWLSLARLHDCGKSHFFSHEGLGRPRCTEPPGPDLALRTLEIQSDQSADSTSSNPKTQNSSSGIGDLK